MSPHRKVAASRSSQYDLSVMLAPSLPTLAPSRVGIARSIRTSGPRIRGTLGRPTMI